ncbi:PepSY domain-containing protein [Adhaeribacter sp. BT258]|uniref:PepSY domain-containing protein n=1 Tax=Adhaeribacter terrigena TaxID=2793070 RepID=A0ABS1C1V7_9BACT|nr:PepSY-associated TM helix domain-containing protein [Adhaeribacter terrigena]MBK0403389.1 PepSY domain-containing protein [Adhaeribacter terrigena]
MKNFFRDIHLYLSLAAGLVIAVLCFTGAALVFEKELQQTIYPERYLVKPATQRASLEEMVAVLKEKVPGAKVSGVKVYADPSRTVEINYLDPKDQEGKEGKAGKEKADAKTVGSEGKKVGEKAEGKGDGKKDKGGKKEGGKEKTTTAFMNPYSGELISLYSHRNSFFYTMFATHRWLLADDIGKMITGVSTLIFLFILLTGIILWWPKNKKILKQRLRFKWDGGWKRMNHDLHIVLGFYTAIFLFAFAFTGLAWSFKWFNDAIYVVTNSENKKPEPPKSTLAENTQTVSFDQILATIKTREPEAQFYSLNAPKEADGAFSVSALPQDPAHEKAANQYFFDQYSGNLLEQNLYADKNLGQRVRATFYPVHVGSIGGLPGRIIAFLACIAGVTFPISGIILWINRLRKKDSKKAKKKARVANAVR